MVSFAKVYRDSCPFLFARTFPNWRRKYGAHWVIKEKGIQNDLVQVQSVDLGLRIYDWKYILIICAEDSEYSVLKKEEQRGSLFFLFTNISAENALWAILDWGVEFGVPRVIISNRSAHSWKTNITLIKSHLVYNITSHFNTCHVAEGYRGVGKRALPNLPVRFMRVLKVGQNV